MTLLVRDEADIIEENIAFHFAKGVDFVIVTDNGSRDGTLEILERLHASHPIRILRQPRHVYRQRAWVTRMARIASADYDADWVINNDADEFWVPVEGDIGSVLASVPASYGAVEVPRWNHPAIAGSDGPPLETMVYRDVASTNSDGAPLPSKVCHRGYTDVVVAPGSHGIERPPVEVFDASEWLGISHFPERSFEQLESKVVDGGLALETGGHSSGHSGALRRQYERALSGSLRESYDKRVLTDSAIADRLSSGTLVEDTRIQDTLIAAGSEPVIGLHRPRENREPQTGTSLLVVAGMHRSGTSLIARIVNLLGVDLGDATRLMGPKADNPKGFWENLDVAELNDDLLAELGGRWDVPPVATEAWEFDPALDPLKERATNLVHDLFPSGLGAVKDPRMSLSLPFWDTVAEIAAVVLTVRHPAAVAQSLKTRDGMDEETAAHLWLEYTLSAASTRAPLAVVDFDEFVADPDSSSVKLAATIGMPQPTATTLEEISSFVDPTLRHHDNTADTRDHGPAMGLAIAAYSAISTDNAAVLGSLHAQATQASLGADVAAAEAANTRRAWAESRKHATELVQQRDRVWAERDEISNRLAEEGQQRALVARRLAIQDRELGDLERTLALTADELRSATTERDGLAARLAEPGLRGVLRRLRPTRGER